MRSSDSGKKQNFFWRHFNGIAMAAIVLIPTIYTTLFLGSMWDPYGNVDQLPVAVVNNDKSVDYEGKTLAVGDELVDKLKENDQLDFHFVSADKAEKGIADGTYYMVITIPSDFSENASTLMDDEPKKMELQYATNPGTNYIASKMSETALAKIQKEVSESVTKEYTETIFDQMGTVGDGMSDAADGALQIKDGVSDLQDGNTTITDNLKLLSDSTLTFVDGAKTLQSGLQTYTDGVATVNSGAQTLSDGMDQLASGAGTLADGAVALSDGSGTLSSGVNSYTDGVAAAYSGAQTLSGNSSQLQNGAASLTSGAAQLQAGSAQMTAGLQTLSDSLGSSLSAENLQQMEQLSAGLTQLQQGIDTLNTTLQNTSMPDTSALTQALTASLTAIGTSAQDAGAQLQSLQSALTTMTQTEVFQSLDAASQQQLLIFRADDRTGNRCFEHRHTGDRLVPDIAGYRSQQFCRRNGSAENQRQCIGNWCRSGTAGSTAGDFHLVRRLAVCAVRSECPADPRLSDSGSWSGSAGKRQQYTGSRRISVYRRRIQSDRRLADTGLQRRCTGRRCFFAE